MRTQLFNLALLTGLGLASVSALAEPAVQAGETLESLSKVKINTTVNGQPGSLNELVSSGQVKLLGDVNTATASTVPTTTNAAGNDASATPSQDTIDPNQPALAPQADVSSEPQQLSNDADNIDPVN